MKCCRLKKELVRHPELSSTLIKTEVKPPLVQLMGSWLLVPRTRWYSEEVFDEIIKPVSIWGMFRFGRLPASLFHPSWGSFWCLRFDFFAHSRSKLWFVFACFFFCFVLITETLGQVYYRKRLYDTFYIIWPFTRSNQISLICMVQPSLRGLYHSWWYVSLGPRWGSNERQFVNFKWSSNEFFFSRGLVMLGVIKFRLHSLRAAKSFQVLWYHHS